MLFEYYKCEQKKFYYQIWNIIVLFGILVLVPIMILTLDSYSGETGSMLIQSKLIQGFYLGQAGYVVLTALYFGGEYQKSTLRTSLLITPKRNMFLISKILCILIWSVIILLVDTFISTFFFKSLTIIKAFSILLPAYLSTLEIVIITSAIVVLTRSMVVTMSIMLSLILGLGNILIQYSSVMKYFPVLSTMNSFFVVKIPNYLKVNDGIAVQGLWAIVLLVIAFIVFKRRYVR